MNALVESIKVFGVREPGLAVRPFVPQIKGLPVNYGLSTYLYELVQDCRSKHPEQALFHSVLDRLFVSIGIPSAILLILF